MLEIASHQYLKKFVNSYHNDWNHIYSFGRIISKSLQTNDNYLINSEIFQTEKWIIAILISLFIYERNTFLVITKKQIDIIKDSYIPIMRELGFNFYIKNDFIIFKTHTINLLTLEKLVRLSISKNSRIILSGVENLNRDIKRALSISLDKNDWYFELENLIENKDELINTYNFFKKVLFSRIPINKKLVCLKRKEISFFYNFFSNNNFLSEKFIQVREALVSNWACWGILDHENFEWSLYLEPIDELSSIKLIIKNNQFVFLSALRDDLFFQKSLKKHDISLDLRLNFKSDFKEKEILIYTPPNQILPNNPLFNNSVISKCIKLLKFSNGFNLILSNEKDLKINLATKLAASYGRKVLLETLPQNNNEILCSSYEWWIHNLGCVRPPDKIK